MKQILLDCDGVLLDWCEGFRQWFQLKHKVEVDPRGPSSWNMMEWLGNPDFKVRDEIDTFNSSSGFGYLEPIRGAINAVKRINNFDVPVYVITSCSTDSVIQKRRVDNLEMVFGASAFEDVICLPLGASKRDTLKKFEPGIWVEDNYMHALDGLKAGHQTFMLRQSHNIKLESMFGHPNITWMDDWYVLTANLKRKLAAYSTSLNKFVIPFSFVDHLAKQRDFSLKTFGPGHRTEGVLKHIESELEEIRKQPDDIEEWVDLLKLAFDGAMRRGFSPEEIISAFYAKQVKNEARTWPDWRDFSEDEPIEHVRT